ncbi:39S ribosomal protein L43, mitochondrial [Bonamia ostreae]|uniref:Large ribosomal subunit protein mL43 n=1 Tax=Bonamia ostreae TaxID=126728 RepID=A0ABV2AMQ0_9EUKA
MSINGIPQLKKIVLSYCKVSGSSLGVKAFLVKDVIKFSQNNPHIEFIVRSEGYSHPKISAHYVNGFKKDIELRNKTPNEIQLVLDNLRTRCGDENKKRWLRGTETEHVSLQGEWRPGMYETQMDIEPIQQVYRNKDGSIFRPQNDLPKIDWKRIDFDKNGKVSSKAYRYQHKIDRILNKF